MVALTQDVYIDGTNYPAGTDSGAMPTAVVDKIRSTSAWVGGSVPALSAPLVGKPRINSADLATSASARAALGIEVDLSRGHVVPTGTAPTVAAQASAGTSATVTVAGRDTAGVITLTSGSASLATGNQVVVTFNQSFAVAPVVMLTPVTAALTALHPYVAAATTTSFTIGLASAPSATTAYVLNYVVVGK